MNKAVAAHLSMVFVDPGAAKGHGMWVAELLELRVDADTDPKVPAASPTRACQPDA
jgi:hypothetical protein